ITPRFKAGDFNDGITRGVEDIITVLSADASEWEQRPSVRLDSKKSADPANWLIIAALVILAVFLIVSPGFRWLFLNVVLNLLISSGGSRSSGGFSSGGGFSGGGGSSGGGGASGSW
ncbi:MAG: TPM domain-containing protein, partial [Candidatus Binatia bacterium]